MTVGDRIKQTRLEKGIGQTDLAVKCDISKQTLYKYETNIVTNIPLSKITNIANALNVSEAYLMGWEEAEQNANMDVALSNMNRRLKEYALRFSKMSAEKQDHIMKLIDMLDK